MTDHVIVHHAGCPDGVASAAWLGRHLGESDTEHVEHVYGAHGKHPTDEQLRSDYTDKFVWFVDFCWPAPVMELLKEVARRVIVLDHHQTSLAWLQSAGYNIMDASAFDEDTVLRYVGADAIHDQSRSGIGLVSAFVKFAWDINPPSWFKYIEDRDLWRFQYGDFTRDVCAAATSYPYTVESWNMLIDTKSTNTMMAEGAPINRFRDQLIEACVANAWQEPIAGHEDIWVTDAPYTIASDVAGILAERDPHRFAAYFVRSAHQLKVGLRSESLTGMNVATIAEQYDGGGHPHAAGFSVERQDG